MRCSFNKLKAVHYFLKKNSIVDVWHDSKYASEINQRDKYLFKLLSWNRSCLFIINIEKVSDIVLIVIDGT